ncbi:dTDP-4-dehydrorhamnose 3,5-epimerase family protein [Bradyrhizobium sp. BWA-3-5]|uniref:dTDP-4-dehydrorhamnose 3,5-epimerase family protein n=1 Tax=Bradyrhizobium sp. BWA-3-5 TaxID=3080013 RepID=UPI00293F1D14|nr:dTDP-4-dehydrorhamnose 3,5-epimerase family protein [Bradyrhizobium sp. BWA-3-5]WOH63969.1 dTDP-4-dehydrorhamnose 3,5-epimerase family protein [Bradyrhizobium sp. BWA-3-5]
MKLFETDIAGVWVAEGNLHSDHRGSFHRLFCANEEQKVVGARRIVQISHSLTNSVGAVRGLHYQNPPMAEMKIVRCLRGRVFDVAVDLRKNSPTFLKWAAVELTPASCRSFIIPEGCAHGLQALEENSELLYLNTAFYSPSDEGAVRFDDPMADVIWPLPPTDLSARDSKHPLLDADFKGLDL